MLVGLYSASTGMQAGERLHEVVSENLAHIGVAGYRANIVSFRTLEKEGVVSPHANSPEGYGTIDEQLRTDFTQGPLSHTGRSLDLAISGDGFFVLQGPDGPLYTRNGVFYVGGNGELVNSEGIAVMGDGGPLTIPTDVSSNQIHVAADGSVSVNGSELGRVRVVRFADRSELVRAGTTTFEAPGAVPEDVEATIFSGSRELSNVSAVTEMVRMIEGMRYYEAAQKALTTMDEAIANNTNPDQA